MEIKEAIANIARSNWFCEQCLSFEIEILVNQIRKDILNEAERIAIEKEGS